MQPIVHKHCGVVYVLLLPRVHARSGWQLHWYCDVTDPVINLALMIHLTLILCVPHAYPSCPSPSYPSPSYPSPSSIIYPRHDHRAPRSGSLKLVCHDANNRYESGYEGIRAVLEPGYEGIRAVLVRGVRGVRGY